MNSEFFNSISRSLSGCRIDSYRQDGVVELTAMARYLFNIALCQSLYSSLQMAEVAFRNAMHNTTH